MSGQFTSYDEALKIVLSHLFKPKTTAIPIDQCTGRILAEPLVADRDFPPFDRVTMDGIALSFSSYAKGQRNFRVVATIPAGAPMYQLEDETACVEVMTGAILPKGVDTVIPYEDIRIKDESAVLDGLSLQKGKNIHSKGMDRQAGDVIVKAGQVLREPEITIAATIGKSALQVLDPPKTLIASSGDELVEINETPQAHQIRKSNVYGIRAFLQQLGISADLAHLPDQKDQIQQTLSEALKKYDCVILSGGVSRGKFDFIPEVLQEIGVSRHFHKVRQRPGKPFWFGTTSRGTTFFALPGNPVSSFMCAVVYIGAWIGKSFGQRDIMHPVRLAEDVEFKPDLTYFLQAKTVISKDAELQAKPVTHHGSGDFANLTEANGFVILPPGKDVFKKDELYDFIPF